MLFDKAIAFTDIHFGERQNAREHNQDCIEFIHWIIEVAKKRNIKTCLFLGDWHHSRRAINVETLHYSVQGIKLLSDYFEDVYFLEGNHDLFYRENRDISSVSLMESFKNVHIFTEPTIMSTDNGDVGFFPWLVEDEWKDLKGKQLKYVFGHFELPHFLLNAMIRMPETGELSSDDFKHCDYVFSGHFHKRQFGKNVTYIGNAFPHNFNDVDDKDRGGMILEWDAKPEFINWERAPSYRRWNIQQLIDDPDATIGNDCKIHAEITYPDEMSYSQACNIRDNLSEKYDFRVIKLKREKIEEEHEGEEITTSKVKSVDTVVLDQLMSLETETYDKNLLIQEYKNL